jgi:hypothetical protein
VCADVERFLEHAYFCRQDGADARTGCPNVTRLSAAGNAGFFVRAELRNCSPVSLLSAMLEVHCPAAISHELTQTIE